jgi:hypothetical protein
LVDIKDRYSNEDFLMDINEEINLNYMFEEVRKAAKDVILLTAEVAAAEELFSSVETSFHKDNAVECMEVVGLFSTTLKKLWDVCAGPLPPLTEPLTRYSRLKNSMEEILTDSSNALSDREAALAIIADNRAKKKETLAQKRRFFARSLPTFVREQTLLFAYLASQGVDHPFVEADERNDACGCVDDDDDDGTLTEEEEGGY